MTTGRIVLVCEELGLPSGVMRPSEIACDGSLTDKAVPSSGGRIDDHAETRADRAETYRGALSYSGRNVVGMNYRSVVPVYRLSVVVAAARSVGRCVNRWVCCY